MMEGVIALMIPIVISLGVFMMIWGIRYLENKENMAMIERGLDPKKDGERKKADPSRTLKNALTFIGAGLGLIAALIVTKTFHLTDGESTATYFGLIAMMGGMGMLAAYLYERKNPPTYGEGL